MKTVLARPGKVNLAGHLESDGPLAITRYDELLGFDIPAHRRNRKAEEEAMRAAARNSTP